MRVPYFSGMLDVARSSTRKSCHGNESQQGREEWEAVRAVARVSRVQGSKLSQPRCSPMWSRTLQRVSYERTRITGRPAIWRASMNEANGSPVSPLPEYVSSCSSGNSSKGSSPSSNCRQRQSSSTSPLAMRRVFTLLNDLRSLRHTVRSTSLCSSDDKTMFLIF